MKPFCLTVILLIFLPQCVIATNQVTNDDEQLENIVVPGDRIELPLVKLFPEQSSLLSDTAEVLKKMPGAYVNRNGSLSGIAQYRGLFGDRVNITNNGHQVLSSCSNAMDAPMSHVPAAQVDAVVLYRGISPVSQGMETIGGSIDVISKKIATRDSALSGELNLGYNSVNDGVLGGLNLAAQDGHHGWQLGVNYEDADSYDFAGGTNYFTGIDRQFYKLSYQYDDSNRFFEFTTDYNDTGATGTPALPMDITYAKGGVTAIKYNQNISDDWSLFVDGSYQGTDHVMDNFRYRQQMPAMYRESLTTLSQAAFSVAGQRTLAQGALMLGYDYDATDHTADISNPNNAGFAIKNYDTERQRHSLFAEWQHRVNQAHSLVLGVRATRQENDAAEVASSMAMMNTDMGALHRTLRDRFNAADRSLSDSNVDLAFNWKHTINDHLQMDYGVAVKNRVPGYQELYLWLPLEATAGLADGRQYLGNLDLNSETAYQLEWGVSYQQGDFQIQPHLFYHRISDYIQGVPNTQMPAPAGTLRYDNVDAELYGADITLSYRFSKHWSLTHVSSYVRGQRRDIDDNLYRIAPLNGRTEVTFEHNAWQLSAEMVNVAKQDKVAITNTEKATPGYGLLNLAVDYKITQNQRINARINNVFDKRHYDHTGGYNRNNLNNDVGFNGNDLTAYRLPGEGVAVAITYFMKW
ncbi:MAG: TonB-dependent receptor [Proteobacteria bacterium]|nr:MAG: TonB-dependent receptor [Pseudomonadota bacterium]